MKVTTILGTRPEIIKLSALIPLLDKEFDHRIIHSGQHYDHEMDGVFFEELKLRRPDVELKVGSRPHGEMTGDILKGVERDLTANRPDAVIVQGDTNTTLAGALAAQKMGIPVIHVEAGCRSFNKRMPEEINRIVADHLSSLLLTMDEEGSQNLEKEGITKGVRLVGNSGIDAFLRSEKLADAKEIMGALGVSPGNYALATIHRAEATDNKKILKEILTSLGDTARVLPVVVPAHPRLKAALGAMTVPKGVRIIAPQGYLPFIALEKNARFIATDSGGVQLEAALAKVPCLVLRSETEYVELEKSGALWVVGREREKIVKAAIMLAKDSACYKAMRSAQTSLKGGVCERILKEIKAFVR